MAVIEKIRRRSGLVITIIGIALVAFVLGDLLKNPFRGGRDTVAEVNGEKISRDELSSLVNANKGRYNSSVDNSIISNNVLEQMIRDIVMTEEFEDLGLNVSTDEVIDLFLGNEPHEAVADAYAQNVLSREYVASLLSDLDNADPNFITWKNAIEKDRLENKFRSLVNAFDFVPTRLAQKYYENKNTKYTAEVVALRYSAITDSIVLTDSDKKAFYDEFKYNYPTDETRGIEYVVFDVTPSEEDVEAIRQSLEDIKGDFETTTDIATWVNTKSDTNFPYDSTWKSRAEVPASIESVVFEEGNQPGFVYGPYLDGNYYNLVRIVDLQDRADSLRANYIRLAYGDYSPTGVTKERAQALADSLVTVLNKDAKKFAELAKMYSNDSISAKDGYDTDWFVEKRSWYPYEMREFLVNNPVGKIGSVDTPYGFIVMQVADKAAIQPQARIAIVKSELVHSTRTYQEAFNDASTFAAECETYEKFNKAVEARGLVKRTYPIMKNNTFSIPGVEQPRGIVQWAFNEDTEVGDVQAFFEMNNMFIVAALTDRVEEGYLPLEKVVEKHENEMLNWKRGQIAVKKMSALKTDYDRMVSDLGAEILTLPGITMESKSLPSGLGVDGKLVGTILGMKEGDAPCGPVAGNICALIVKKVTVEQPEATSDYSGIIQEKTSQFTNAVFGGEDPNDRIGGIYRALREKADIEDHRTIFF